MKEKLFDHDGCPNCTYLGQYKNHDLYHCTQGYKPTVIARFGSEDHEYKSGMSFVDIDDELGEAHKRSKLNLDVGK